MKRSDRFWTAIMVLAAPLPAAANNPPQPDGLVSLILIFPIAILAFRFAGASLTEKEKKWRWARGLLLFLALFFTIGGTEIALIPLVILLLYGLARGAQVLRRGQGARRALGLAVMAWTLFAIADYAVSLNAYPRSSMAESTAVRVLRTVASAQAEAVQRAAAKRHLTIADLREKQVLPEDLQRSDQYRGYLYKLQLSTNADTYLYCAVPLDYLGQKHPAWIRLLPGYSLGTSKGPRYQGRRSFCVDETGVIRWADLGGAQMVTRDMAAKWEPL